MPDQCLEPFKTWAEKWRWAQLNFSHNSPRRLKSVSYIHTCPLPLFTLIGPTVTHRLVLCWCWSYTWAYAAFILYHKTPAAYWENQIHAPIIADVASSIKSQAETSRDPLFFFSFLSVWWVIFCLTSHPSVFLPFVQCVGRLQLCWLKLFQAMSRTQRPHHVCTNASQSIWKPFASGL